MLNSKQIKELVERIASACHPEKIVLFGSYASGKATSDSDVDFLVILKYSDQPRPYRARDIRKHLWGLTEVPKDIFVYTEAEVQEWGAVPEALVTSALSQGQVVYEN